MDTEHKRFQLRLGKPLLVAIILAVLLCGLLADPFAVFDIDLQWRPWLNGVTVGGSVLTILFLMKNVKLRIAVAGVLITVMGWMIGSADRYPLFNNFLAPGFRDALFFINELRVAGNADDLILNSGIRGFSAMSDFLEENISVEDGSSLRIAGTTIKAIHVHNRPVKGQQLWSIVPGITPLRCRADEAVLSLEEAVWVRFGTLEPHEGVRVRLRVDQGSQYISRKFKKRAQELGIKLEGAMLFLVEIAQGSPAT